MALLLLVLFSFCYSFVISVDGVEYHKQDFYSKYSMVEWERAPEKQRRVMLEDYIKRESAVLAALSFGFNLDPVVVSRLKNIKKQLLVNFFYDKNVAFPLLSTDDFFLTHKNLKKEVEVKHLLIAHNQSDLQKQNPRSKNDAVKLINDIRLLLNKDVSLFDSLALVYSDDPGIQRNLGDLGWLEWGRTPMSFQSSVWGVPKGAVSAPIETPYGYHLAYVVNSRDSQFFYYDSSSYRYEAIRRSLPLVKDQLSFAALAFEERVFSDDVIIHKNSFDRLFSLLEKHKTFLSGGERFIFGDFLTGLDPRFVLFTFNGDSFGVRFFLSDVLKQSPSRLPDFLDSESLVSYFKQLMLRHIVELRALEQKIGEETFFKKRFSLERGVFLYDFYLKTLINSVSSPDSSSVKQYYLQNRENKYFVPEKVVVRQIRLKNKDLADSLSLIVSPNNFQQIASSFSINRKSVAGLMDPFERGKFNNLGEVAFSLGVGDVSDIIENLDKTFSIIMLEEKIKKEHLPLTRVYKRIESLLLKEGQENIKKTTFDNYLNNKALKLGDEYKIYFN